MKILITFREGETDNLFVHTLCMGIRQAGANIDCSTEKFWMDEETHYDIIHFQWPEELVGWNCCDEQRVEQLHRRIDEWRARGSRFVYTRHNIRPHYGSPIISAAYNIVEQAADMVVHMGRFSQNEFQTRYPQSHNMIIPHHIYENCYREDITQTEARRHLGIAPDKFVITAFGKFRNHEEMGMVLQAFRRANIRGKYLLAPRLFPFYRKPWYSSFVKRWISQLAYHMVIPLARLWGIRGGSNEEIVSDEELPYYVAASDVVIVQRKQILNSGNIPLAFLFHKIVIGPDTGNISELLHETGNPLFVANDTNSIVAALQEARALKQIGQGERNYQYAMTHLRLEMICQQYITAYQLTLQESK